MKNFNIQKPDAKIKQDLIDKIDNFTKPKGSLGRLEDLALQIGLIQQSLSPKLVDPEHIVFSADHGIVDEGVSYSPKEVTWQQMSNFIEGGGGINFLCRQHGFKFNLVDSGVDFDFPSNTPIIDKKIRKGTSNYLHGAAMSNEEMDMCIERGAEVVDMCYQRGCNVICFGELGMSNTSSSSMWMSYLANIPLKECVGAGSGMIGKDLEHKYNVLYNCGKNYETNKETVFAELKKGKNDYACGYSSDGNIEYAKEIIRWFGGFEMVMAVGGMLRAAELKMTILIDGFIMTNCILAAKELYPNVIDYAIFGHCGDEMGHKRVLDALDANPILSLGLRLGEGSGAICAYPIIESAIRMMNEMKSFKCASVTKYFE